MSCNENCASLRYDCQIMKTAPMKNSGIVPALLSVCFLILMLTMTVFIFGTDAIQGPAQVSLTISGFFAALLAMIRGSKWDELESGVIKTIGDVTRAVLILLLIGALIGVWILAGVVPTIVVWGLKILKPSFFLFAACVISGIVSLATGSSWSTAGTIGVALIGIGQAAGIDMGMTAGAIISGAYFGDKISPFSETTNLASSMAGSELFEHIRHMLFTTVPAVLIALALYLFLGMRYSGTGVNAGHIAVITDTINANFNTSLFLLIPPALTIGIMVKRVPAIPAIMMGIVLGLLFALAFQRHNIQGPPERTVLTYITNAAGIALKTAASGYHSATGVREVDDLLSKGGMAGMLNTIWLILSAMFFAGVMEGSGMLHAIALAVLRRVRSTGNLILATLGTCLLTNILASDQYLSIVITGRMYKEVYENRNLHMKNLSRALEDAGTLTSPLVPWNTCGSFMASSLGVATFAYLPFAFMNLITPLISMLYGYTGFTIARAVTGDNGIDSNFEENPGNETV